MMSWMIRLASLGMWDTGSFSVRMKVLARGFCIGLGMGRACVRIAQFGDRKRCLGWSAVCLGRDGVG